jgi:uncharacterized repeat protein (TIGR01451 family)
MAHVTTPRWQSPVSRRILFIVVAAAAALILLTSLLVSNARATTTVEIVDSVPGDACQYLEYGIDAQEFVVPVTGSRYSATFDLGDGVSVSLTSPPNRKFVDFTIAGATVNGAILFNRVDQDQGTWYDYDPAVNGGRLEPPPRDSGNDKKVVLCLAVAPSISIDAKTNGADGLFIPVGDPVTWSYLVTNTGNVPLTSVLVTDTAVTGITCPVATLAVGAQTTCSANGTAVAGQFTNTGTVTAAYGTVPVTASDGSSYFGSEPGISVDATTSGSDDEGTYAGPGDGIFIAAGDTVTWTYAVTNTGNVTLTNVGVTDTNVTGISCDAGTLAPSASTSCSATGTAEESEIDVFFTNSGTATGTPPVGAAVTHTDGSSYFGYVASLTITATLNGVAVPVEEGDPNPVVSGSYEWVFTLTNTGNVGVDGVVVDEDGTEVVCDEGDLGTVPPGDVGNPVTCTFTQDAPGNLADPEVTTTFTVTGDDPNGNDTSDTTESITYFVGLDCGDDTVAGGPELADNPLAGFFVGPLKVDSECAVPVFIDTTNTLDEEEGEQTVFIGPPDGYDWTGVTGLLTVEWDVEDPADAGVRPTFQDTTLGVVEIPICGGDVAVSINEPTGGDFFYTMNDNPAEVNGTYPLATGGGDICLVLHTTKTIDFEGAVKSVTVEVFYIYNDPQLIRPK